MSHFLFQNRLFAEARLLRMSPEGPQENRAVHEDPKQYPKNKNRLEGQRNETAAKKEVVGDERQPDAKKDQLKGELLTPKDRMKGVSNAVAMAVQEAGKASGALAKDIMQIQDSVASARKETAADAKKTAAELTKEQFTRRESAEKQRGTAA